VILFLGAEFTQAYLFKIGKRMEPSKYAVPITEEARANEGMSRKDTVCRNLSLQRNSAQGPQRP
jgi:hypothetical protein